MPNPRRLALFLDGTWNVRFDNTNVWRLRSLCDESADQLCYYSEGVGTQYGSKILGGLIGLGIDDEIARAYEWLVDNYSDGARIYIFGFSRGAFTARSVAGLISRCGILKRGSPLGFSQLYDRYRKGSTVSSILHISHQDPKDLAGEDGWLRKYSQAVPIHFQGVWDTVGALGIPVGHWKGISSSWSSFLETDLHINDTNAYHALAIDEHRTKFQPTLWVRTVEKGKPARDPRPLAQVEQRWFVGAHSDVGGGYSNGFLAQRPLKWLMDRAVSHGLQVDGDIELDADEAHASIHDSYRAMFHGWRRILQPCPHYRPLGADAVETDLAVTTSINETIDGSVFTRWQLDADYRPPNLRDWAARRGADLAALRTTVLAVDPTVVVP